MDFDFNEWARDLMANIDFWLYDVTRFFFDIFHGFGF